MLRAVWVLVLVWCTPLAGQAMPLETYRQLRPQLLQALSACSRVTPEPCEQASVLVRKLNAIAEQPLQRAWRPRCLGALAQLETELAVFRWGFDPRSKLQQLILTTQRDCPPP